ncbi:MULTISPECIES: hypothetical protein [unclassified Xanthobacter]|uniref:hypothetical protein n=1 Tax=unclassified Xanthobacter TaxID=2623496 RepID=UPI001F2C2045|nr:MULTISPECIES: hypothetical protein [unclassified Xanthobacter]
MPTLTNEAIARSVCERGLRAQGMTLEADIQPFVDRFWQIVAAQLDAQLIDISGRPIQHTIQQGIDAYWNWCLKCAAKQI